MDIILLSYGLRKMSMGLFFLISVGVWVSLHVPQLIS